MDSNISYEVTYIPAWLIFPIRTVSLSVWVLWPLFIHFLNLNQYHENYNDFVFQFRFVPFFWSKAYFVCFCFFRILVHLTFDVDGHSVGLWTMGLSMVTGLRNATGYKMEDMLCCKYFKLKYIREKKVGSLLVEGYRTFDPNIILYRANIR